MSVDSWLVLIYWDVGHYSTQALSMETVNLYFWTVNGPNMGKMNEAII